MSGANDNGYISDYLIHWTGKKSDEEGVRVLTIVASTLRLLLSYNCLHIFHLFPSAHKVCGKMVCFTDVPLRYSSEHCKRYGRFGIAFRKLNLMNKGAQPVFYASHACKEDMNKIFSFLQEQHRKTTLPPEVFKSLLQHFFFIQRLSDNRADRHDTFYYEREWRIGEHSLLSEEQLRRPNAKYRALQEGYSFFTGRLVTEGDKNYFAFNEEDVAFLIAPSNWHSKVGNNYGFPIKAYEDLVSEGAGGK